MGSGRWVGVVATALTLAVAGCGGGGRLTKAAYEQKLREAGKELAVARQARPKDEFKDDVTAVQHALDHAADQLGGISPPADVEAPNDRLVHGLRGLSDDFGQLKAAADQGVDAARRKGQQIATGASSREAQQAIQEIQRRGYDVGQLGS